MIETHTNLLNYKVMNKFKKIYDQFTSGQIDRPTFIKKLTRTYKGKTWWDLYDDFLPFIDEIDFNDITPLDSDKNVSDHLYDFMTSHTYDNGLPLTGENYPPESPDEWNDYFDHYDRDQDRESEGLDKPIDHFRYDEEHDSYIVVIQTTLQEFVDSWIESYDNSSYEHDFG